VAGAVALAACRTGRVPGAHPDPPPAATVPTAPGVHVASPGFDELLDEDARARANDDARRAIEARRLADAEATRMAVPLPRFIRTGPSDRPLVCLTVDDVFSPADADQLTQLLDVARAKGFHFTVFPTGGALETHLRAGKQDVWRRLVAEGHEIGNHTYTHSDLTRLSDQQIRDELNRTQAVLDEVLGYHYQLRLMRPRGGSGAEHAQTRVVRIANEMGYSVVRWDVDSNNSGVDAAYGDDIAHRKGVHGGSIVLLHFPTFHAPYFPDLVDRLRVDDHLEPVTVSQLFG
jgi:peptidoglycan/xylan/chitin deacetylase (PgdA/CDA1 family)